MSEVTTRQSRGGYVERPHPSSLADILNIILDKGLVIDAYVRVAVVGIELITIDARIVIASVDTYLRFAEATNRLDLERTGGKDLTELGGGMVESGARGKTKGILGGAKEALFGTDDKRNESRDDRKEERDDREESQEEQPRQKRRQQEEPRRRPARKE